MANISNYTSAILTAIYGRDVRQALVNALEKVNDDNNSYQEIKAEILQAQSEVDSMVKGFEDAVASANTAKVQLQAVISDADSVKLQLNTTISTAGVSRSNLETTITNAKTSKTNLETAISNANEAQEAYKTAKSNLDASITTANQLITNLNTSINNGNTTKSNLDTSIQNSELTRNNLNLTITSASTSKSELETTNTNASTVKTQLSGVITEAAAARLNLMEVINEAVDLIDAIKSAGSTQVQNVTSAGSIQVNTINSAGSMQVQSINEEGESQLAAIRAKVDEVTEDMASKAELQELRKEATTSTAGLMSAADKKKVDGIETGATGAHFATCVTAAGTAAKAVTLTEFSLVAGAKVTVKFTNAITVASATLNVNSTGAKTIIDGGIALEANRVGAGTVLELLYDGTNWVVMNDTDSGWLTLTPASGFTLYSSTDESSLKYRRVGKVVEIGGVLSPASAITGSPTDINMFTLPEGFRPNRKSVDMKQGSGRCVWAFTVNPTGLCSCGRYRDETGYATAATNAWLPCGRTFMV